MGKSNKEWAQDYEALRIELEEAKETLAAIHSGQVDAVVVSGKDGAQVYTLQGADRSYRLLMERMGDGAVLLDEEGVIAYCNRRFADLVRLPLEKVTGTPVHRFADATSVPVFQALLDQGKQDSGAGEVTFQAADGTTIPVHISARNLHLAEMPGLSLVVTDLSAQKRQEAMVAAERLARSILDQVTEAIVVCETNGTIIRASQAAHVLCARNPLFQTFDAVFPLWFDNPSCGRGSGFDFIRDRSPQTLEAILRRPDGENFHLRLSAGPLRDGGGQTLGWIVTLTDLTESTQAAMELADRNQELAVTEEELRTQNDELLATRAALEAERARYKDLFEFAPDGYLETDPEGVILEANHAASRLLAGSAAGLKGRALANYIVPGHLDAYREYLHGLCQGGSAARPAWDVPIKPWTGPVFWGRVTTSAACDEQERLVNLRWLIQDITSEKRAEEALQTSEERFRLIADALKDYAIIMLDPHGRVLTWNLGAQRLKGYAADEILHQHFCRFYPPEDQSKCGAELAQAAQTGRFSAQGWRVRKDGSRFWADVTIAAIRDEGGTLRGFAKITRDMTERRQAEEALRRGEEERKVAAAMAAERQRFLAVLETLPVIVTLLRPDHRVVWVNQAYREALGDNVGQLCHAAQFGRAHSCEECQAFLPLETGRPHHWEWTLPNGRTFDIYNFPFTDADGSPLILEMDIDITERRQAEAVLKNVNETLERQVAERTAALRESERRLALALDSGQMGLWEWDVRADRSVWNAKEFELLGLPVGDERVPTDLFFRHVHPDDLPEFRRVLTAVMKDASELRHEFRVIRGDGQERWLAAIGRLVCDPDGRPLSMIGVNFDITDRKRAEEALRASEQEFRSLAEAMPQIVWATRPDGWNIYFNQRWVDYTGLTLEESYGHGWNKPFHPDDKQRAWEAWQRATQHNERYSLECRLRRADGVYRWWLIRGEPMRGANGEIVKWFGTCTDIEELKQAEEAMKRFNEELEQRVAERTVQLQEMVEELQRSNEDLERFAYISSHDLQEPVRMVSMYAGKLAHKYRDKLDADANQYIDFAVEGAQRMSTLIKDLLEYSRINTEGRNLTATDAQAAAQRAVTNLHIRIKETGAQVTCDALPTVLADRSQLAQVFQNLIENAIKYRKDDEPPKIHIGAEWKDGRWLFSVKDNGIGIDPKYHDRVFVAFKRLHADRAKYPGSGIGLAIVKRIIERHGGQVCVDSKPGEGSTFYFTLPR